MATSIELHVAPGGNDAAAGTAEQPLATLSGASDRARELRPESPALALGFRNLQLDRFGLTSDFPATWREGG